MSSLLDLNRNLLKKTIVSILIGSMFFLACRKSDILQPLKVTVPCVAQIVNPAGKSYAADEVVAYTCTDKHCGILPLSNKNYWIYADSIFTDGLFTKLQFDTLRYQTNIMSVSDGLVWWEGNISVGLPAILYANDSSIFVMNDRLFTPGFKDVKIGRASCRERV